MFSHSANHDADRRPLVHIGLKIRKEHTQLDKDLSVAVCYFPCEGSPHRNSECFEILQNDILKLYNPDDSYFFLTGDFNSRIKDLNEILQIDQIKTCIIFATSLIQSIPMKLL